MRVMVITWIIRGLALGVLGPLAGYLSDSMRASDGSEHATLLVSGSPIMGALKLVVILALSGVVGVLGAKLVNRKEGILVSGFVIGWSAIGTGRVTEALRDAPSAGSLVMLALEGLIVTLGIFVVLCAIDRAAPDVDRSSHNGSERAVVTKIWGAGIGIGLVCVILGVWLQGVTDLPGQAVWSAFVGGAIGGLVSTFVMRSIAPDRPMDLVPLILGVSLAGIVAPLLGFLVPGTSDLLESVGTGSAPAWLNASPLAFGCGALIGAPAGAGWAESSFSHASHKPVGA